MDHSEIISRHLKPQDVCKVDRAPSFPSPSAAPPSLPTHSSPSPTLAMVLTPFSSQGDSMNGELTESLVDTEHNSLTITAC